MLKKPAVSGKPARANPPAANVQQVIGRRCLSPLKRLMSITPPIACITLPEARNRSALKKACVKRWNIAATTANFMADPTPAPNAMNMKPSWLTVEYAITRFRSVCVRAINAASNAVAQPITATIICTEGTSTISMLDRAIR